MVKTLNYSLYDELSEEEMRKLFNKFGVTKKSDAVAFLVGYNTLLTSRDYDLLAKIFS